MNTLDRAFEVKNGRTTFNFSTKKKGVQEKKRSLFMEYQSMKPKRKICKKLNTKKRKAKKRKGRKSCSKISPFFFEGNTLRRFQSYSINRVNFSSYKRLLQNRQYFRRFYGSDR